MEIGKSLAPIINNLRRNLLEREYTRIIHELTAIARDISWDIECERFYEDEVEIKKNLTDLWEKLADLIDEFEKK